MTIIIPQRLPCSPTYANANVQNYVQWKPTMFLHYFNDSDVDVTLVISSEAPDYNETHNCYVVTLPANDETLIGTFNCLKYGSTISINSCCKYPTDVTVAALYTRWSSVAHHHQITEAVASEEQQITSVINTTPLAITVVMESEQHITGET